MNVTYLGHACFLFEIKNKKLLFDPFIRGNPLVKDKISIEGIKTDYVLISHGHEDHLADAEFFLKKDKSFLISNNEIVAYYAKRGICDGHPFNTGGKHIFDFGTVRMVSAMHSSVMPDETYGGAACGFVVTTDEGTFYYAGDTGLTYDMKIIGENYSIDFALMPIGGNYTMDAEDAVIASEYLKCHKIIGMHYNTWPVIGIDTKEAARKFKESGKELIIFQINETKKIFWN